MLCSRRAARSEGSGAEASLYMGEAYWQLGMVGEAVAAWREAVRRAPTHLGARHALTESLMEAGDIVAAGESVRAALALDPDCRWARSYGALVELLDPSTAMVGDEVAEAWRRFAAALVRPGAGPRCDVRRIACRGARPGTRRSGRCRGA